MDSRHGRGGGFNGDQSTLYSNFVFNKGWGRNSERGVTASEYSTQCLHTKAQHVITYYLIAYRENQALGHMLRLSSS